MEQENNSAENTAAQMASSVESDAPQSATPTAPTSTGGDAKVPSTPASVVTAGAADAARGAAPSTVPTPGAAAAAPNNNLDDLEFKLNKVDFKNKKVIAAIVAVVVVVVVIAAAMFLTQGKTDTGDGYVLSNQKIETIDGLKTITGTIKNTSGHEESFMVTWKVLDASGNELGQAMGATDSIPNGGSAPIEGILLTDLDDEDAVSSFELEGVFLLKQETAALKAQLNALS